MVQKRMCASTVLSHPRVPCMLVATLGLTQKNARIEGIPKVDSKG